MAKQNLPSTPALLALRSAGVAFGTHHSATALGVDEHQVKLLWTSIAAR